MSIKGGLCRLERLAKRQLLREQTIGRACEPVLQEILEHAFGSQGKSVTI
jgi:hypothetical protein